MSYSVLHSVSQMAVLVYSNMFNNEAYYDWRLAHKPRHKDGRFIEDIWMKQTEASVCEDERM